MKILVYNDEEGVPEESGVSLEDIAEYMASTNKSIQNLNKASIYNSHSIKYLAGSIVIINILALLHVLLS